LKLRAQRLHAGWIKGRKKARQGAARGQVMATKERHEDFAQRRKTFIKGLEGGFATDGITEKHHHEINRVVLPKACASELHVFLDSIEQTNMGKDLGHRRHFSHP